MTRAEFIRQATEEIEEAIMKAQGIGDWMPERSPETVARHISFLLPGYVFEEEPKSK